MTPCTTNPAGITEDGIDAGVDQGTQQ